MAEVGTDRPFAPACERNQQPILEKLNLILKENDKVFEIGSGTGQHAVYFSNHLPYIQWTTSDLLKNHGGIKLWLSDSKNQNVLGPREYESKKTKLPIKDENVLYTANTFHIMPKEYVLQIIQDMRDHDSIENFIIYGPFNYGGKYTSEGNANFDIWLEENYPGGAIRDFEWIQSSFLEIGFEIQKDIEMPANNRLLLFEKVTKL